MNYLQTIIECINSDPVKRRALLAVRTLELPDWLIAAGFVRNAIWDQIYGTQSHTNDIDVIYFCKLDISNERDLLLERRLTSLEPDLPWSVKNQARMHVKNGDQAYINTFDAMAHWPEKQTSIGVRVDGLGVLEIHHCFDLSLQFNGKISHNPLRAKNIFMKRVNEKEWLTKWPELSIGSV